MLEPDKEGGSALATKHGAQRLLLDTSTDGNFSVAGTAGVPERIPDMPLTEVKLVNIKLLTLAELKLITDRGAEGRRRLSELFATDHNKLVSSLNRASVV